MFCLILACHNSGEEYRHGTTALGEHGDFETGEPATGRNRCLKSIPVTIQMTLGVTTGTVPRFITAGFYRLVHRALIVPSTYAVFIE